MAGCSSMLCASLPFDWQPFHVEEITRQNARTCALVSSLMRCIAVKGVKMRPYINTHTKAPHTPIQTRYTVDGYCNALFHTQPPMLSAISDTQIVYFERAAFCEHALANSCRKLHLYIIFTSKCPLMLLCERLPTPPAPSSTVRAMDVLILHNALHTSDPKFHIASHLSHITRLDSAERPYVSYAHVYACVLCVYRQLCANQIFAEVASNFARILCSAAQRTEH